MECGACRGGVGTHRELEAPPADVEVAGLHRVLALDVVGLVHHRERGAHEHLDRQVGRREEDERRGAADAHVRARRDELVQPRRLRLREALADRAPAAAPGPRHEVERQREVVARERHAERRVAVAVDVVGPRAAREQHQREHRVLVLDGERERRPAALVLGVDRHARRQVPQHHLHLALDRRLEQPRLGRRRGVLLAVESAGARPLVGRGAGWGRLLLGGGLHRRDPAPLPRLQLLFESGRAPLRRVAGATGVSELLQPASVPGLTGLPLPLPPAERVGRVPSWAARRRGVAARGRLAPVEVQRKLRLVPRRDARSLWWSLRRRPDAAQEAVRVVRARRHESELSRLRDASKKLTMTQFNHEIILYSCKPLKQSTSPPARARARHVASCSCLVCSIHGSCWRRSGGRPCCY